MTVVADMYAKVGETFSPRPTLRGAPNPDGTPGPAQDLTAAVGVTMSMRPKGGGVAVFTNAVCTIVAPAINGQVAFDSPAVLSCPDGLYEMDFTVTFPGAIVHKWPDGGPEKKDAFLLVKISEKAA